MAHRRDQTLSQISAERNRSEQTADKENRAMIDQAIAFYKTQIKEIDKRIAEVNFQCEELASKAELLATCPGVGMATIGILLSELPELGSLNRGQVSKLVGVAPIACDRGTKEGKRKIFAGRSMVRKVLYMAALVATKYNQPLRDFYLRLVVKGSTRRRHAQVADHFKPHNENETKMV